MATTPYPRHQSDRSTARPTTTGTGRARFIGRIGALAVTLGVGAAVATTPGIAFAGPTDSTSPSADSGTTGDGGTPNSATTSPPEGASPTSAESAKPPSSPDSSTKATASTSGGGTARVGKHDPLKALGALAAKLPRLSMSHDSDPAQATPSRRLPGVTKPAGIKLSDAASPPPATASLQRVQVASVTEQPSTAAPQLKTAAVQAVPAKLSTPAAPLSLVSSVLTGVLSFVGLSPSLANGPAAPIDSPALWTTLAWARREIGGTTAPLSAATTPTPVVPAATLNANLTTLAVSPLGTEQQLAAEKIATQTANSLPVQLMKLVLQAGWLGTANSDFKLVGGVDQENKDALAEAVDEYAMGAAFQQQILDSNNPTVVMQVAPPHTWYGQDVSGSRILYDNPDTIYRFMGVNNASTYVIKGRFTGEMPADTTFSVLTGLSGTTAAVLTPDDIDLAPDGSFTITVDGRPTAIGEKNHIQLTNDSTLIAVRNTLSDWNSQDPMSLSIERVSGPPDSLFSQLGGFAIPLIGPTVVANPWLTTLVSLVPPLPCMPPIVRGTITAVVMVLGLSMESKYIGVATTDPTTGQLRDPNKLPNPTRNAEFLATQLQSAGYFQLADDEALVVTINPGQAGYFTVPVTNDWTITDNYWDEQTSLNSAQALPNCVGTVCDGTYTIVISPTDPHVANWVSTGGLNQGTISIRFQDLDPDNSTLPTVSSQVVSLAQLPSVLPPGTVYVTDDQREDQLELRKAGYDKRFAPYPQP